MPFDRGFDINFDMNKRRYAIPSASALVAFESAARHRNFSRAAEELHTSQSAISRHVAELERRLDAQLFHRQGRRLDLTEDGSHFYRAVVSGLENIQSAAEAIRGWSGHQHVTIACSHEISHLFLMPRFEELQSALGTNVRIRVMTYEYDVMETGLDPRVDVMLTYRQLGYDEPGQLTVLREGVRPICSPSFFAAHQDILLGDIAGWSELPFLKLTKPNLGWATWEEWLTAVGTPGVAPVFQRFDNYVYLLEAAAAGRGLALGWQGLVERYFNHRTLMPLSDNPVSFDRALVAVPTRRGRTRRTSDRFLEFLEAELVVRD